MNEYRFTFTYGFSGRTYALTAESPTSPYADAVIDRADGRVRVTIRPKAFIAFETAELTKSHPFADSERFFGNGYQSWSTSREYAKSDRQPGVPAPLDKDFIKGLPGISSDVFFCPQDSAPGHIRSHCYTYIKDVENPGKIAFCGSLNERTGFTWFSADLPAGSITVHKDVEGVETADEYELFDLIELRGSFDEVFDAYFAALGVGKPRVDHLSGYTSWYNYFQKIDQNIILRDLNDMDPVREHVNIFQVDDGYETFVGDWLDPNPKKFPDGMAHVAKKIHDKGYMAGIWLAPFNLQIKSRTFRDHPDWIIRTKNGKPLLGCAGWGGAYTMNIYKEEPREYIRHFFDVILNEWGYDMVKLDFLYSQCQIPRNGKSRGQIMCEGLDFLRECCGDKLILGCGVPIGPAITTGVFDACRVTCDVSLQYNGGIIGKLPINAELPSAIYSMTNSVFRRQLNGRAFLNDPDVFFLRYKNLKFNMEQKMTLATVNHIFGDVLFVSDDMAEYTDADFEAVKKLYGKSDFTVEDVNYVDGNKKIVVSLRDAAGRQKMLWFSIASGFGSASEIIGLMTSR